MDEYQNTWKKTVLKCKGQDSVSFFHPLCTVSSMEFWLLLWCLSVGSWELKKTP